MTTLWQLFTVQFLLEAIAFALLLLIVMCSLIVFCIGPILFGLSLLRAFDERKHRKRHFPRHRP